jgi:hypothetical protein
MTGRGALEEGEILLQVPGKRIVQTDAALGIDGNDDGKA